MFAFFKRKPEPDMIRLDTHKEIVAEIEKDVQAERETVARLVGKNANHLTTIACLKQEVAGLRSDVRQAEAAHDKAVAELATLRPDAEKHRERVRKATMNLKQNRAKVAPAVRLEAAEPPNDPYDTARDSRRDDREIHSL